MTPPSASPQAVVSRLGAVQAQDFGAAKWGVGLRGRGLVDAEVERAFNAGELVRTHVLRPTWHFVAPADLRWLLRLTAPRVHLANGPYYREAGIDAAVIRRSTAILERVLRDRNYRTRAELGAALTRGRVEASDARRLSYLMMRAELDGVVCSGPLRGKQHTYALLEERVPPAASLDRDDALHELARRYISTRGPATAHDLAWFSGLTVAEARRGIASLGGATVQQVDGRDYWTDGPGRPRPVAGRAVHLLPNFDEYFIGLRDRGAILDRLRMAKVPMPTPALERHVIAVGGQLVGGWKRTLSRKGVTVELQVVVRLSRQEQQALTRAVEAYGDFLQLPMEIGS
ncbi:MAG TPA: winged helix DNA-binding domain-containing protein [Gemmatimonadales bacterium]|nr:winged helix DNA-binding domain-containing protein [Gemmatimonadales bacterium]